MTVTLAYTDYLGSPQSQSFNALYIRGLGTPDKVRFWPPKINKFPDGSKKTVFKGFKRVITVALAAQTTYESFLQAFLWAPVKTVSYTDPVLGALTATCAYEGKQYEAEWIDEFSLTKRYTFELVESTLVTGRWVGPLVIDSWSESHQNGSIQLSSYWGITATGQAFHGNGRPLSTCQFYIAQTGSALGVCRAKLYAQTGTFETSSLPTGTALATSTDIVCSSISSSPHLETFTFPTLYTPTNGVAYVIALECTSSGSADYISFYRYSGSHTGIGNSCIFLIGAWNHQAGAYAAPFYCNCYL